MLLNRSETLRLLIASDSADGAERIVSSLKNSGIATRPTRVEDLEDMHQHLDEGNFDILMAAESLGDASYEDLLNDVRTLERDIPVIIIMTQADISVQSRALDIGAADAVPVDEPKLIALVIRRELANLYARRAQRRLESALHEAESRNRLLLDNSRDAIAYLHDGMHIYANEAYIELFGYTKADNLDGMPVIDLVDPKDLANFKNYLKAYSSKGEAPTSELRFHGLRNDGQTINAMMTLSSASYEGEPCTQIIIRIDQGEEVRAELAEKLREASTLDTLTGLGNRNLFESSLEKAVSQARSREHTFALLYISIDHFNTHTATFGLAGSDSITQEIATHLTEHLGRDHVFRFADSTFTALMLDTDATQVEKTAGQLLEHVKAQVLELPDGRNVQLTLSAGAVCFGETARNPDDLLSLAAAEKARASERGGHALSIYDPAQNAMQSSTAMLELLQAALEKNQFKLLYQSLVDVNSEGIGFYEVYLRLPLNDGEVLEPDQFLPTAQHEKLATKIDRWVLLNACKQLKDHIKHEPNSRLLINLSGESLLEPGLAAWVGKLARATSKRPGTLVLQFQEQDITNYLKQAGALALALKEVGCDLSISRFGCSLDPMNTLRHVEASYIKLDGSFTQDLGSEENLASIRQLTAEINGLYKKIIVPYVESTAVLTKLWSAGVRYLQGYFLHRPEEKLGANPDEEH